MSTINDRFIIAEEAALKAKVSGLQVTYPQNIDVDVWFRWPNKEVRAIEYPFIAIDLADVVKADDREHAGDPFELTYQPHGYVETIVDPTIGALVADDWPTPYDLTFTVAIISLDPRHDRELKYKLLGDRERLPHRLGYLEVEDGVTRRMDVIDVSSGAQREAERTLHATVFTLRVETELFVGQVEDIYRVFDSVNLSIRATGTDLVEEIATIAVP